MCKHSHKFNKPLSVESLAYSHGLFCASHPGGVLTGVGVVVILCSLPFFITTSGDLNSPKTWKTQWLNYRTPITTATGGPQWIVNDPAQFSARTPSWFLGLPLAVVQQVYVSMELDCDHLTDLCRKSHYSKSRIVASHLISRMEETISVCQPVIHPASLSLSNTLTKLTHQHPHTPPSSPNGVLSPGLDSLSNKWNKSDKNTLGYHSLKELLYGGFWELDHQSSSKGGVSSGSGQHHMFALTFVLQPSREGFKNLSKCVSALQSRWPKVEEQGETGIIQHFYFEPEWRLIDFAPLIVVYSIVFLYISFSVGKIDLVQSKVGLGFTACITVVASLTMSLGICTFFGVSISLSGSEIYPYVVITIGLENILIIVKAVISTPEEFEVKYRIAAGLSKEGWAITRNLLTLLCMISLSILFFNYRMKEFCIIALVGLMCDAFLQLVFFLTVLSIDLRRLELSDLHSHPVPLPDSPPTPDIPTGKGTHPCPSSLVLATPTRWRSKRVKFVYFLARVRPVSRALMVAFSVVVIAWFSNTQTFHEMVANLLQTPTITSPAPFLYEPTPLVDRNELELNQGNIQEDDPDGLNNDGDFPSLATPTSHTHLEQQQEDKSFKPSSPYLFDAVTTLNDSDVFVSRVREMEDGGVTGVWRNMVTTHWPRLLQYTGHSMEGRFLTLLPPISLSLHLGFSTPPTPSQPHTPMLAHLLSHPFTLRAAFIIVLVVAVVGYTVFLVRSSNNRHLKSLKSVKMRKYSTRVTCLKGHKQDIDCVCTDSSMIVSASLDGDIRVWDGHPGRRRCLRIIVRSDLCGEPSPNSVTTDTSNRPAADGCEDDRDPTPSATPLLSTEKGSKSTKPRHHSNVRPQSTTHSHSTHSMQTSHTHSPSPVPPHTSSASSFLYKSLPLTHPPSSPSGVVTFNVPSPPPSPVYYNPNHSNLQTKLSKSQDSSVYHPRSSNLPNPVQLVSATKVTPSPQQTCMTSSIHSAHSQYSNIPRQYASSQYNPPQTIYTGTLTQSIDQNYAQSNLYKNENVARREEVTQQTKSHSRAQSHGQFTFQSPGTPLHHRPHSRSSVPHISVQVSPSKEDQGMLPRAPSRSSLQETSAGGVFDPQAGQGALTRKHSSQGSLTHSSGQGFGSNEIASPRPSSRLSNPDTRTSYPQHGLLQTSKTQAAQVSSDSSSEFSTRPHNVESTNQNTRIAKQHMSSVRQQPSPQALRSVRKYSSGSLHEVSPHHTAVSSDVTASRPTPGTNSTHSATNCAQFATTSTHPHSTPNVQVPMEPPVINTWVNQGASLPPLSFHSFVPTQKYVTAPPATSMQYNLPSVTMTTSVATSKARKSSVTDSNNSKPQMSSSNRMTSSSSVSTPTCKAPVSTVVSESTSSPKGAYRRGHTRNRSLGNDLPHNKRPLSSMGHTRNRSLGSITGPFPQRPSSSRQASVGNLSVASGGSVIVESPFFQTPNPDTGYDFGAHFDLFSQYTANMALQYCTVSKLGDDSEPSVPPVWCMDIWNGIIAVGCGNGQVEAWNADTGSLIFCLSLGSIGIATIAINSQGIFIGHMDGFVKLIGHNGLLKQTIKSHTEPISVLCCHGDRVVAGSYDSVVSVYRSMDLVLVNSLHIHEGTIRDIICVQGPTRGCVSGCSKGLIVHWDTDTCDCIHDYGMYEGGVVKLGWTGSSTIALFTDCIRVWDCIGGGLLFTLSLDGVCNNFAVLSSKYIATSVESLIVIYDIETGKKHSERHLQPEKGMSLVNHILTIDEASILCTSGKDIHIVPCQVKLKMD